MMQTEWADSPQARMAMTDRVLVLEPIEGKATLSSTGMVDKRLFNGENRLHAIKDEATTLWYCQYDSGRLPEPLQQRFTGFKALLKFVEDYMLRRNVRIKEVIY
jgi:hypothetical protein